MQLVRQGAVPTTDFAENKTAFDRALFEIRRTLADVDTALPIDAQIVERLARRANLPPVPELLDAEDTRQRAVETMALKLAHALSCLPELARQRPLDGLWARLLLDEAAALSVALEELEAIRRQQDAEALETEETKPEAVEPPASEETHSPVSETTEAPTEPESLEPVESHTEPEPTPTSSIPFPPPPPAPGNSEDTEPEDDQPEAVEQRGLEPLPTEEEEPSETDSAADDAAQDQEADSAEPSTENETNASSGVVLPLRFSTEDRLVNEAPATAAIEAEQSPAPEPDSQVTIAEADSDEAMSIPKTDARPLIEDEPDERPILRHAMSIMLIVIAALAFGGAYMLFQDRDWSLQGLWPAETETVEVPEAPIVLPQYEPVEKVDNRVEPKTGDADGAPPNPGIATKSEPGLTDLEPAGTEVGIPPLPLKRSISEVQEPTRVPAPPSPAARPARNNAPASAFSGKFAAQVGSYQSQEKAEIGYTEFSRRFQAQLEGQSYEFQTIDLPGRGQFIRLRIGPFETRDAASAFCFGIKSEGGSCIIAAP